MPGENTVYLSSSQQSTVLRGQVYVALAPLLTGRQGLDDIVSALQGEVPVSAVWHALTELDRLGYLAEEIDGLSPGQAAFWSALGIAPSLASDRLAAAKLEVRTLGGLSPIPLTEQLETLGMTVRAGGELLVVLTDDYLREELAGINREALEHDLPWYLVKPTGVEAMIGPLFVPRKTACWECLASRLNSNLKLELALDSMPGRKTIIPKAGESIPAGEQAVSALAALELAKWIVTKESATLENSLLTLELNQPGTQPHAVQRLPRCPSCGKAAPLEPQPLMFHKCPKKFVADGGHRTIDPRDTFNQYAHLVDPLTGLVSQVTRMTRDGSRMHLYLAGENRALHRERNTLRKLKASLHAISAGKGLTDMQARTSALCEALEHISGVYRGDEPVRRGSYSQLGAEAIHPDACQQFSKRQYEQRDEINGRESDFYYVPQPFDEDAVIAWAPAWSLTNKRFCYLPAEYCYFSYPEARFAIANSNGNAAGNTLEEAALQGLLELVERDGVALWWYNRLQMPEVDLESLAEPCYRELLDEYRQRGRRVWALDITSDLGIPTFAVLSCRDDAAGSRAVFGFGAHLDPKIALSRAVSELNQSLALMEAFNSPEDRVALTWLEEASLANQSYLSPDRQVPARQWVDYRQPVHEDLLDDIKYCKGILEVKGLEVLVLDQTRADIGMPVVKVIVPGLRHFWAQLGPGRLYEVPVRMGYLERAKTEDEMNPIPVFW